MILIDLPRSAIQAPGFWRSSPPVPFRERPKREVRDLSLLVTDADRAKVKSALDAIPNGREPGTDLDYDDWYRVMCGVHHTWGELDGIDLIHEFSARSGRYDAAETDRNWQYVKTDRNGASLVTGGTIIHLAGARHGWIDPDRLPKPEAFAVVPNASRTEKPDELTFPEELPTFARDKAGAVLPTMTNACAALRRFDLVGMRMGLDTFRDEIMLADWSDARSRRVVPHSAPWTACRDTDTTRLRVRLEALRFKSVEKGLARDALELVAWENQFDSASLWLSGLQWDGVRRVDTFLRDCFDVPDGNGSYARAVSRYIWTALAGRVACPGIKADMAVIFTGDQGSGKTSAIEAMAPAPEFFAEVDLTKKDDDLARVLRGVLVAEITELKGLSSRDAESIKAFISRRQEKWIPKYHEFASTYGRRALLFGTTNQPEMLADDSGERRMLPLRVTGTVDVERVRRECLQLWAEGAAMFFGRWRGADGVAYAGGVAWQEAQRLATDEHAQFKVALGDPWTDIIGAWLDGPEGRAMLAADAGARAARGADNIGGTLALADVAAGALRLAPRELTLAVSKRVGAALRSLGFVDHRIWVPGCGAKHRWFLPLLW